MRKWKQLLRKFFFKNSVYIEPDEMLIDTANIPAFDEHSFEGRIERPITKSAMRIVGVLFLIAAVTFAGRLWMLQIVNGAAYAKQSEDNRLRKTVLFAERGVFYDRNDIEVAWNVPYEDEPFAKRVYYDAPGLSHLLGYIGYPLRDSSGIFYRETYVGQQGAEQYFDSRVAGENGIKLVETDALGAVQSESVVRTPLHGDDLMLSIDARIQSQLYALIASTSEAVGFEGGAGVIMDVHTGEIIALTSYPEYDAEVLSEGRNREAIQEYVSSERNLFLNRAVTGLYTPGSIIKPFIALAALEEEIISPEKQINSTGALVIPNPYNPDNPSVFRDWKAHGWVDMRHALAVSSDQYFYTIGGGFEDQEGLGIRRIDQYLRLFGFEEPTGIPLGGEVKGTIPTPEWKEAVFGEPWLLGNTYHTSIGQYGFQTTVLQVVRAIAVLANNGELVTPVITRGAQGKTKDVAVSDSNLQIVREGMRLAVREGTASGLNTPYVSIAAKTGTAELGSSKDFVNSWVTGYFPYENPHYAFAVMMERGPATNLIGGVSVMRKLFDWMNIHTPEYFATS
jgi:penicillin-binding protein 2